MVTMVTKQKIFDQLYIFWEIQWWTFTSQKFHVPRSRKLWNNRGSADPPPVSDVIQKPLVSEGLTIY